MMMMQATFIYSLTPSVRIHLLLCIVGMYMNTTQAALCEDCPAGFYCVDSAIWPLDCPAGEVCPGNTGYNSSLCPQVRIYNLNYVLAVF